MSPSSTVHGGQHDTKYVKFELLMHAAFVADENWGFMREPARIQLRYENRKINACGIPGIVLKQDNNRTKQPHRKSEGEHKASKLIS